MNLAHKHVILINVDWTHYSSHQNFLREVITVKSEEKPKLLELLNQAPPAERKKL